MPSSAPKVIAHRGARLLAVENTLEALRIGFAEGADGVEFDVQLTRDGELVLFHDDDLQALTGARGTIASWNFRDLRQLTVTDKQGRTGKIPHFDQVQELLAEHDGVANLEIKVVDGNGQRLADAVLRQLGQSPERPWLISSFDRAALAGMTAAGPDLPRALLIDNDPRCDWWSAADIGPDGTTALSTLAADVGGHLQAIHPHGLLLTPERVRHWHRSGLAVNVWTLNEPAHWSLAVAIGADGIVTDDPGGLATWLDAEGA
ncbi:MAG: hypothetical protein KC502_03645 [Myxococcales bacterium]|nr:hypothetical protein [Myxococcales bacterium]